MLPTCDVKEPKETYILEPLQETILVLRISVVNNCKYLCQQKTERLLATG